MKIGVIREGKTPPDSRVPLTPAQCRQFQEKFPQIDLAVQPSEGRCYSDEEYQEAGIRMQRDMSDRDVLLGVKEVPIDQLLDKKMYFFFSHTIKAQPYNQGLLQAMVRQGIQMVDWETLTDDKGRRVIAFGRWAGIVGAHNGLWTWGQRTGAFSLPRAKDCRDFAELKSHYQGITWPPIKIALSGGGRVTGGSIEVLEAAGIRRVSPQEFLNQDFDEAVYAQLDCPDIYRKRGSDGSEDFDFPHFFGNPGDYEGIFEPYTRVADLFINAIYWDPAAPVFFTREDMQRDDFRIRVIADITCDIEGSVPSTLRATTIPEPLYGYDPQSGSEVEPHGDAVIDTMSIDNLPNELPRDASEAFGDQFLEFVASELLEGGSMIDGATICRKGALNAPFEYLRDYLEGR